MKAEGKSANFLKNNNSFYRVPYFQRGYVWDKDNWNGIWNELSAENASTYLGAIVLKNNETNEKTIIDGQQRLTTLTILMRALYDYRING